MCRTEIIAGKSHVPENSESRECMNDDMRSLTILAGVEGFVNSAGIPLGNVKDVLE